MNNNNRKKNRIKKSRNGNSQNNNRNNQTSNEANGHFLNDIYEFAGKISIILGFLGGVYFINQINNKFGIEINDYILSISEEVESIFQLESDLEILSSKSFEPILNVFKYTNINNKEDFKYIQLDFYSIDSLKENIATLSSKYKNKDLILSLEGKSKEDLIKIFYRLALYDNIYNVLGNLYSVNNEWQISMRNIYGDKSYSGTYHKEYSVFSKESQNEHLIKYSYRTGNFEEFYKTRYKSDYSYKTDEEIIIPNTSIGREHIEDFQNIINIFIIKYNTVENIDEKKKIINMFLNTILRNFLYYNNSEENILNKHWNIGLSNLDYLLIVHYFLQEIGVEHTGVNLHNGDLGIKIIIGNTSYIISSFRELSILYWKYQYYNYDIGKSGVSYKDINIFSIGGNYKIISEGNTEDFLLSELFNKESYILDNSEKEFSYFYQRVGTFTNLSFILNPDNFRNIQKLIYHFIEIKRYRKAIEFLKILEERYPNLESVILFKAEVYEKIGYNE